VLSTRCRVAAVAALAMLLMPSAAQPQVAAATLTLEEAIQLAERNNPDFLQQANDVTLSDWAVRGAYGQLLPSASLSTSYSYTGEGEQRFGNFTGSDLGLATSTDYHSSSYSLGMSARVSGASLLAPAQAKAQRTATSANIDAAAFALRTNVSRQYIAAKRAHDGVTLAQQELVRADENLKLAQARVQVGAAIPLEAQQAQVERGRAEVALLQAENLVQTETLRLSQVIGVELPANVQLTTQFAVRDVPWTEAQLLTAAMEVHPALRAARATNTATDASVRMARSAYLPSLSVSAGVLSGFARRAGNSDFLAGQAVSAARANAASQAQSCTLLNQISAGLSTPLPGMPADCSGFTLTPAQEAEIAQGARDRNSFDFSSEPYSLSVSLSLPLFDGFSRERQLETARVARTDAQLRLKSEELRVRTELAAAHRTVATARRSAELEARNAELAQQQLVLARERYRVGASSFIELQEAETIKARADRAHLAALYQFHESLAALEAAVGRSLTEIR
jgi:outer membrane protein